jgi:hypothetical protein
METMRTKVLRQQPEIFETKGLRAREQNQGADFPFDNVHVQFNQNLSAHRVRVQEKRPDHQGI